MKIICRHAKDDFDAERIANAMEVEDAYVFSIMPYCSSILVWAKVIDEAHIQRVDRVIKMYG